MKTISPAYDPVAGVWFTDDGVEAKTIRDLIAITGCKVEGYRGNSGISIKLPQDEGGSAFRGMRAIRPSGISMRMPKGPDRAQRVEQEKRMSKNIAASGRVKWTPQLIQECRNMVKSGMSYSEVAQKIGTTRSSIIGKLDRAKAAQAKCTWNVRAPDDAQPCWGDVRKVTEIGDSVVYACRGHVAMWDGKEYIPIPTTE